MNHARPSHLRPVPPIRRATRSVILSGTVVTRLSIAVCASLLTFGERQPTFAFAALCGGPPTVPLRYASDEFALEPSPLGQAGRTKHRCGPHLKLSVRDRSLSSASVFDRDLYPY